jgi:hypothetical protein
MKNEFKKPVTNILTQTLRGGSSYKVYGFGRA